MNTLKLLEAWVNQNSHFKNPTGVKKILDSVAQEAKTIGCTIEWSAHESNPTAPPALIATLAAESSTAPLISLISHADTVFPVDSPFQKISWSKDNKTAIGPGVIDDKGGILVALLALEKLAAVSSRKFTIQFLCMPGEEIGSPGFHQLLKKQGERSSAILGFEPSLADGSIIHSRRGNRWYEIKLTGPGGHAGRDAGRVLNPLTIMAERLAEIAKLTDLKKGVSATPGSLITNTTGFNVIPSEVIAKVDVRYDSNDARDELHTRILPFLNGMHWTLAEDCPAMPLNEESKAVAARAIALIQKIENRSVTVHAGHGSSDCNYAARAGIPIVDGLGAVGTGLHAENETLEVASLETRAAVVAELIQTMGNR